MTQIIRIHQKDNVAVAVVPLKKDTQIDIGGVVLTLLQDIPAGHKLAVSEIKAGEKVIKYAYPIGHADKDIPPGEWVHTHNLVTDLSDELEYAYNPSISHPNPVPPESFMGYVREDGGVGVRNEIWIVPTVGCVNGAAEKLAKDNAALAENTEVEGIYAFPHPYGCSQTGDDHEMTRRLLAALAKHPNAGGVLVVGLGCENNTMEQFKSELGSFDVNRIKFLVCQQEDDEFKTGAKLLKELVSFAGKYKRQPVPVSSLVIGMKCGGSDGLSGITANPAVGAFSDMLIARGGSTILTEVPEMFGAETLLMNRAVTKDIFDKTVDMINGFKRYFIEHGQTVYENPSPGNKGGGISTLEDKSLGCVQKGGTAPVHDVIGYAQSVRVKGLTLMSGPGNDLVSTTALTASGAHIVLFTTGRGTPFGSPVPTLKISSNSELAAKKANWIDFDAGTVANGESVTDAAARLFQTVIETASGIRRTKSEENGYHEIAIFKNGVTL